MRSNMEKKKLNAVYVLIGVMAFILVNYPIVEMLQNKRLMGIPLILMYLGIVVLVIGGAAFLITQLNENED